jgi:hypothetical protein
LPTIFPSSSSSERDDAAASREVRGVAYREQGPLAHFIQVGRDLPRFLFREKNQLAIGQLREALRAFHDKPARTDRLAAHRLIKGCAERVFAEHADFQRLRGVGERGVGPFDKLDEVVEKNRLDLIFA